MKFISTGLTHSGDGNRRPKKATQTSEKAQHKALQEDTKKITKIETYYQNRPTKTVKNPKTLVNEISQKQATCPQEVGIIVLWTTGASRILVAGADTDLNATRCTRFYNVN